MLVDPSSGAEGDWSVGEFYSVAITNNYQQGARQRISNPRIPFGSLQEILANQWRRLGILIFIFHFWTESSLSIPKKKILKPDVSESVEEAWFDSAGILDSDWSDEDC